MTDPELVEKKLAFIETCVQELLTLSDPARDDLLAFVAAVRARSTRR